MNGGHIAELWAYPIKGTKGASLDAAEVDERGLKYDRVLAVVDLQGTWITSRDKERFLLAQIQNTIRDGVLSVSTTGMQDLPIDLRTVDPSAPRRTITVKGQKIDVGEETEGSQWFSDYLKRECRLVRMTDGSVRTTDPTFSARGTQTALTDNFPLLVTSQESLDDLNARIEANGGEAVTMRRFRPSIVISGYRSAYENCMRRWRAGEVHIERARPCDRCIATLIHEDGQTQTKEPLATLQTYRKTTWKINDKDQRPVIFGEYAVNAKKRGTLRVGDAIDVLEEAEDGWDRPIAFNR